MYKGFDSHLNLEIGEWFTVVVYELAYALDFLGVELLFRGFMVIGFMSILGRGAIMPMVVTYCFLHFGKPAGEAISSVFGGFILGAIAYETRSIWGGVIIHVGIAWAMELAAFVQKGFNQP
ncbi:MAG: CPBP family intramembrane metalloprotease [Flammeovirgaceae bacterium]|nr:CPBP family intramembrane metalloprotease [Flammeovirgaceae bacterium]